MKMGEIRELTTNILGGAEHPRINEWTHPPRRMTELRTDDGIRIEASASQDILLSSSAHPVNRNASHPSTLLTTC